MKTAEESFNVISGLPYKLVFENDADKNTYYSINFNEFNRVLTEHDNEIKAKIDEIKTRCETYLQSIPASPESEFLKVRVCVLKSKLEVLTELRKAL